MTTWVSFSFSVFHFSHGRERWWGQDMPLQARLSAGHRGNERTGPQDAHKDSMGRKPASWTCPPTPLAQQHCIPAADTRAFTPVTQNCSQILSLESVDFSSWKVGLNALPASYR